MSKELIDPYANPTSGLAYGLLNNTPITGDLFIMFVDTKKVRMKMDQYALDVALCFQAKRLIERKTDEAVNSNSEMSD